MRHRSIRLIALLSILWLSACASNRETAGPNQDILVTVENDLLPPTNLSVFAQATTGGRILLGTVASGRSETFTLDRPGYADYRFFAQATGGREMVSNLISLGGDDAIIWNLSNNIIVPQ